MIEERVLLGERSYSIHIGRGAFEMAVGEMAGLSCSRVSAAVVSDAKVARLHADKLRRLGAPSGRIEKDGTEKSKTFGELEDLCSRFAGMGLDRKSAVFAVGGGVIGDLAGFAASVYMRGIDFYQVPTTLLAMVDSSVGGKTGINIDEGKNLVGAFHQPRAVFADMEFLDTLPKNEFSAGMAEVIKYGLLADREFFEMMYALEDPLNPRHPRMAEAVGRCCALKAGVVSGDERENSPNGGRSLLNLGHTFGHAIEKCAGYGTYLHGEAVSIGMVMAAKFSVRMCGLKISDAERIRELLLRYSLPVSLRRPIAAEALLEAMQRDKKAVSGSLRFVLMDEIGKAKTQPVDSAEVLDFLKSFA